MAPPAFQEPSAHEVVARYTAQLEALFVEHGGEGSTLMQKAARFNFALSERAWDDLCWLNSEGRGVAEHDLAQFRRVAERVIEAVHAAPCLAIAAPLPARSGYPRSAPGARSVTAPRPTPQSVRTAAKPRSKRPSTLRWFVWLAMLVAAYHWQDDVMLWLQSLKQKVREGVDQVTVLLAQHPRRSDDAVDAGTASGTVPEVVAPDEGQAPRPKNMATNKPVRPRPAASTKSPALPTPRATATVSVREPAAAVAPIEHGPQVDDAPAPSDTDSPGKVRMTPEELKKF